MNVTDMLGEKLISDTHTSPWHQEGLDRGFSARAPLTLGAGQVFLVDFCALQDFLMGVLTLAH